MSVLDKILEELDEFHIIENITLKHDEARIQYRLKSNTVATDIEFDKVVADYYNNHFSKCVSNGSLLSDIQAAGHAKNIIEKAYKRRNLDKLHAYSDGKKGTNGGMRVILDILYEAFKEEAIEHHIRDVLDRYVAPTDFGEQVSIVREIISRPSISSSYIDRNHPERYARNYEELIRGLIESIKLQAANIRRL